MTMMKCLFYLLEFFVLALGRTELPDEITAVYFVNWAQYRLPPYTFTPANLAGIISDIDIIYYGFAFFCPDSNMVQPYWVTELNLCQGKQPFDIISTEDKDPQYYQQINQMKTNNNFKFILSIGGWTFPSNFFSGMVSSETSRSTFISSVIQFVKENNFDGVDIDWEYPASAPRADAIEIQCHEFDNVTDDGGSYKNSSIDKDNFVLLMKEMRSAFNESLGPDYLITFCGQAGLGYVKAGFDLTELVEYVDLINIMSYDYTVSDTNGMDSMYTAPNEALYAPKSVPTISQLNVNQTITGYLDLGAPADKLLVGVAYYGHTWFIPNLGSNPQAWGKYGLAGKFNESGCCEPRATYGGPGGNFTQQCGLYSYYEIENANCPFVFNNETQTYIGYCSSNSSDGYTPAGTWITYQGPESIRSIINFANGVNLRGAFGFDISQDSNSNNQWTFDLTQLINQCLKKPTC